MSELMGTINRHVVDTLSANLDLWAGRDNTKPQPTIQQAGNDAYRAIDAMLSDLHRVRRQLVSEIREADDAAGARIDALLAQRLPK